MERFQLANAELDIDVRGEGQTLLFLHGEDYFEQHNLSWMHLRTSTG